MPHTDKNERSRIGREGAAKRWEKAAEAKLAAAGVDPSKRPKQLLSIEDYDGELGRPGNWGDAKRREEVRGELVLNQAREVALEKARAERDQARGRLLTAEQVRDREAARTELILARIGQLVDAAVALVPAEQQPTARYQMDQAVARFRAEIAAAIREQSRQ